MNDMNVCLVVGWRVPTIQEGVQTALCFDKPLRDFFCGLRWMLALCPSSQMRLAGAVAPVGTAVFGEDEESDEEAPVHGVRAYR